jgi:hypothetical protein
VPEMSGRSAESERDHPLASLYRSYLVERDKQWQTLPEARDFAAMMAMLSTKYGGGQLDAFEHELRRSIMISDVGVEVISSILIGESSDRAEVEVLEIDHRHIVDAVSGAPIIHVMREANQFRVVGLRVDGEWKIDQVQHAPEEVLRLASSDQRADPLIDPLPLERLHLFEKSPRNWWAECLVCAGWVTISNPTREDAERKFSEHWQNDHRHEADPSA